MREFSKLVQLTSSLSCKEKQEIQDLDKKLQIIQKNLRSWHENQDAKNWV